MAVNLIQTNDKSIISRIISDDFIWSRMSDGVEFNDYILEITNNEYWHIVKRDDETIGVVIFEMQTSCSIGLYFYLYKNANIYSREVVKEVKKLFKKTGLHKMNVSIPECYKKAINLALKMGFKKEGINRQSYEKDGSYYDRITLGILESECHE